MRFMAFFIPPEQWRLPVTLILGIFAGLAVYVIYISRAPSYLSDEPETCINCHIMVPYYAVWAHSAHREVASCNDCHVPHNNVFNSYYFKAKDGLRHATVFTLRNEPQSIFIKKEGGHVVQSNCIRCHRQLITDPQLLNLSGEFMHYREDRKCWECHRRTPHGRVRSLSATPNARAPLPGSPVPDWLDRLIKLEK